MSIGIAILGAGIFATEEHLPAIQGLQHFQLKAVYSRSQKSAEALANTAKNNVDAYYDNPTKEGSGLDALLKRPDIHAVSIAVSIASAPDLIRKALLAGKNVISEKPIAPTIQIAEELVQLYHSLRETKKGLAWVVGENFRMWKSVERAGSIIRSLQCKILTFQCRIYHHITTDNKYFHSDWRQSPTHPSGFVLDSCIHFVAILRYLLAANGQRVDVTSTYTKLLDPALPPIDSVFSLLQTDQGVSGQFSFSLGIPSLDGITYEIVTDQGNVVIDGPAVVTTTGTPTSGGSSSKLTDKRYEDAMTFGVPEEFAAFEALLQGKELDSRISVEEALADLRLLETMVRSGEQNGQPLKVD